MNFTGKPIPMPLDAGINRCLAHGHQAGEWCERREHCAAHLTIRHDAKINAPAAFRKCMTDNFAAYLPLAGFPVEQDGSEIVDIVGKAFGVDPATLEPHEPEERCSYPKCTCPFDAPADPNWCARGLKPRNGGTA